MPGGHGVKCRKAAQRHVAECGRARGSAAEHKGAWQSTRERSRAQGSVEEHEKSTSRAQGSTGECRCSGEDR
jgi:hypothetical protein